jgi:hypothetical protein
MPFRNGATFAGATLLLVLTAAAAGAQNGSLGDDGNTPGIGDHIRVAVNAPSFVSARGLYANYQTGLGGWVNMESWNGGRGGLHMAFGVAGGASHMSLDQAQFLRTFAPIEGGTATSASGGAWLYELEATFRFLLPSYVVTPTAVASVGFFDFNPSKVHYQGGANGGGTAQPVSGSGPLLSGGLTLDRAITDRTAIYAEGTGSFGYDSRTGYGYGLVTGKSCSASTCGTLDHQKWITYVQLRGGLRLSM